MDGVETYFECKLIKAVGEIFMARDIFNPTRLI